MAGLFVLNLWNEGIKLHQQVLFASNFVGALRKASSFIKESPMRSDITIAVIYAKEHHETRKRRFYCAGESISPWVEFDEAIDDV